MVLSLTGRGATYGKRALNGIQLATDELNKSAAFADQPLKLVVEDSQSTSMGALTSFRKLIDVDHVPVVVGMLLSDEVLTCAPVANETKTVLFTPGAGSSKIRDAGDYVFRNREDASLQAGAIARLAFERFGHKRIAILHSNAANGLSYRDSFKKALETLGGSIAATVAYNEGKTDYRAEVNQLQQAAPEAVYLAGHDTEMGAILKQSRELAFKPQFYASAGAVSKKLLKIAGDGAEGMICATAAFDAGSDDPRVHAFVIAFEERFGEPPDWVAANAYDAIGIVARAIEKGGATSDAIKATLYTTQGFPGVSGNTSFEVLLPKSY